MKNAVTGKTLAIIYRVTIGIAFLGISAQATMVPSHRVEFDKSTEVDLSNLKAPRSYDSSLDEIADETVMVDRSGMEYREEGASRTLLDALEEAGEDSSTSFAGKVDSAFRALSLESVIGTDERVQITNTTDVNARKIGRIALGCTGTLVAPRVVLTAGHCVFSTKTGKWLENLDFTPAQNGSAKPFGTIGWDRAISVTGFTKDGKTESDYAAIILKEPVGNSLGWMAFGYTGSLNGKTVVNINGYPGDKPQGTMWHSSCKLANVKDELLDYPCDTFGGNSGSGVYRFVAAKNERIIYGVHTNGGNPNNWGTRITKAKFERINKWMSENP